MTNNLGSVKVINDCDKHKELTLLKNGGSLLFDQKGRLTFLPLNVKVNNNYIAIILSLKYVNNIPGVCVTIDTSIEKTINVIMRHEK